MKFTQSLHLPFFLLFNFFSWGHEGDSTKKIESIHAHEKLTGHAHLGLESRYFSEGRDALDGKSLWTGSVELGYEHFSGGIWQGRSTDNRYQEWQYGLALTQESDGFSYYAGFTHLDFPEQDESDNEWSFGVAYEKLPYFFGTSVDGTYSVEAKGTFYEWSTYREFELNENSTALISGVLGINDGYVSDGHDGANFYALSLGIERSLRRNLSVFGHGMQSFAIEHDPSLAGDDQLKDFFHFGIGLNWNF